MSSWNQRRICRVFEPLCLTLCLVLVASSFLAKHVPSWLILFLEVQPLFLPLLEGRKSVLLVEPLQNPPHFSSVAQSCPTLCDPMDCSTPGFPVHYQLLELAQTHVHPVSDATQPSHPLSSPSPPAFWGMVLLPLFSTLKATRGQRNPILPWIRAQPEQPPSLKRGPFSRSQCVEDHFANWLTQQITNLLNHG